jgi:hypothetical protein
MKFKPEYTSQFFRLPTENQKAAGKLQKMVKDRANPEYIMEAANAHCKDGCKEPTNLSPIIYCTECPVMKVKNNILYDGHADSQADEKFLEL